MLETNLQTEYSKTLSINIDQKLNKSTKSKFFPLSYSLNFKWIMKLMAPSSSQCQSLKKAEA